MALVFGLMQLFFEVSSSDLTMWCTTKGKATTGNESDVGLVGECLDLQPTSLCLTEGEKGFKAAVGDSVRDSDSRGTAMLIVTKNARDTF